MRLTVSLVALNRTGMDDLKVPRYDVDACFEVLHELFPYQLNHSNMLVVCPAMPIYYTSIELPLYPLSVRL